MDMIEYDLDDLPSVPFNIYFIDRHGEVFPKKVYTVTSKERDTKTGCLMLYIIELNKYIVYGLDNVIPIAGVSVNERVIQYPK